VRRYASDDALELLVKNGGSSGNWAVCGSVWTSALGAAARAEAKDEEKDSVWRICVTLWVLRASAIVGGGMDHIRSAGWISGMKRVMTGSDATEEMVKSTREDGMEQPVR